MRIDFVTLFPGMFEPVLATSIVGRAIQRELLTVGLCNPRDFSKDKHRKVDDRPYGGGAGMVLMAQPLADAIKAVKRRGARIVYLSPQGKRFDQKEAQRLAGYKHLVLVCGHYEGVD